MKLFYTTIISVLSCFTALAQNPSTLEDIRIETPDGYVLFIKNLSIENTGDSLMIQMVDIRLKDGATVHRFNVPGYIVAPEQQFSKTRRTIDRNDYTGVITVEGDMMESDGDLIANIEVRIERQAANNRQSWLILPELHTPEQSETFHGVMITGRQRDRLYNRAVRFGQGEVVEHQPDHRLRITAYTDTLITYQLRLPYEMWMDDASLRVHYVQTSPTRREHLITQRNAGTVKLEPRTPYEVVPQLNYFLPENTVKNRRMEGQAYLDFQVGRSVLLPNFRRNPEELAKIDAIIQTVVEDRDITLNGITLTGYASPEGSYASNDKLSKARAEALRDYIRTKFNLNQQLFSVTNVPEDWERLREMVEESELGNKQIILDVIDSGMPPDQKEARLKTMAGWSRMLTEMFPDLRRTEYRAEFTIRQYSLEEAKDIATRKPENLSLYELYMLAESYPEGSLERNNVNEIMIRQNPEDATAILNYAAHLLGGGDLAGAKRHLDRVSGDARAANNLGVYYLLTDDLDSAREHLTRAQSLGIQQAAHNLQQLEIKAEDNIKMQRYNK